GEEAHRRRNIRDLERQIEIGPANAWAPAGSAPTDQVGPVRIAAEIRGDARLADLLDLELTGERGIELEASRVGREVEPPARLEAARGEADQARVIALHVELAAGRPRVARRVAEDHRE